MTQAALQQSLQSFFSASYAFQHAALGTQTTLAGFQTAARAFVDAARPLTTEGLPLGPKVETIGTLAGVIDGMTDLGARGVVEREIRALGHTVRRFAADREALRTTMLVPQSSLPKGLKLNAQDLSQAPIAEARSWDELQMYLDLYGGANFNLWKELTERGVSFLGTLPPVVADRVRVLAQRALRLVEFTTYGDLPVDVITKGVVLGEPDLAALSVFEGWIFAKVSGLDLVAALSVYEAFGNRIRKVDAEDRDAVIRALRDTQRLHLVGHDASHLITKEELIAALQAGQDVPPNTLSGFHPLLRPARPAADHVPRRDDADRLAAEAAIARVAAEEAEAARLAEEAARVIKQVQLSNLAAIAPYVVVSGGQMAADGTMTVSDLDTVILKISPAAGLSLKVDGGELITDEREVTLRSGTKVEAFFAGTEVRVGTLTLEAGEETTVDRLQTRAYSWKLEEAEVTGVDPSAAELLETPATYRYHSRQAAFAVRLLFKADHSVLVKDKPQRAVIIPLPTGAAEHRYEVTNPDGSKVILPVVRDVVGGMKIDKVRLPSFSLVIFRNDAPGERTLEDGERIVIGRHKKENPHGITFNVADDTYVSSRPAVLRREGNRVLISVPGELQEGEKPWVFLVRRERDASGQPTRTSHQRSVYRGAPEREVPAGYDVCFGMQTRFAVEQPAPVGGNYIILGESSTDKPSEEAAPLAEAKARFLPFSLPGEKMMTLQIHDDERKTTLEQIPLREGVVVNLGRIVPTTDNPNPYGIHVWLKERNVPRNPVRLEVSGGKMWVTPAPSEPSYVRLLVNGAVVRTKTEVSAGDTFQIGDFVMSIRDEGVVAPAKISVDITSAAEVMESAHLIRRDDGQVVVDYRLQGDYRTPTGAVGGGLRRVGNLPFESDATLEVVALEGEKKQRLAGTLRLSIDEDGCPSLHFEPLPPPEEEPVVEAVAGTADAEAGAAMSAAAAAVARQRDVEVTPEPAAPAGLVATGFPGKGKADVAPGDAKAFIASVSVRGNRAAHTLSLEARSGHKLSLSGEGQRVGDRLEVPPGEDVIVHKDGAPIAQLKIEGSWGQGFRVVHYANLGSPAEAAPAAAAPAPSPAARVGSVQGRLSPGTFGYSDAQTRDGFGDYLVGVPEVGVKGSQRFLKGLAAKVGHKLLLVRGKAIPLLVNSRIDTEICTGDKIHVVGPDKTKIGEVTVGGNGSYVELKDWTLESAAGNGSPAGPGVAGPAEEPPPPGSIAALEPIILKGDVDDLARVPMTYGPATGHRGGFAMATSQGVGYGGNEDATSWIETSDGNYSLVVADGMGGHGGGAWASESGVTAFVANVMTGADITEALREAHDEVDIGNVKAGRGGKGQPPPAASTMVVMQVIPPQVAGQGSRVRSLWTGDSEAGILRGGRFIYRTVADDVAARADFWQMDGYRDMDEATKKKARGRPASGLGITHVDQGFRSFGTEWGRVPDGAGGWVQASDLDEGIPLQDGDWVLAYSDGLTKIFGKDLERLLPLIRHETDPREVIDIAMRGAHFWMQQIELAASQPGRRLSVFWEMEDYEVEIVLDKTGATTTKARVFSPGGDTALFTVQADNVTLGVYREARGVGGPEVRREFIRTSVDSAASSQPNPLGAATPGPNAKGGRPLTQAAHQGNGSFVDGSPVELKGIDDPWLTDVFSWSPVRGAQVRGGAVPIRLTVKKAGLGIFGKAPTTAVMRGAKAVNGGAFGLGDHTFLFERWDILEVTKGKETQRYQVNFLDDRGTVEVRLEKIK